MEGKGVDLNKLSCAAFFFIVLYVALFCMLFSDELGVFEMTAIPLLGDAKFILISQTV